jgi:hypothetical protein
MQPVRPQSVFGLFLLPGGLPRRFTAVIHSGGRPRRLPRPAASRCKTRIASSSWSRSARNSASIFPMSIVKASTRRLQPHPLASEALAQPPRRIEPVVVGIDRFR